MTDGGGSQFLTKYGVIQSKEIKAQIPGVDADVAGRNVSYQMFHSEENLRLILICLEVMPERLNHW